MVTELPETVAPSAGAVSVTGGGGASAFDTGTLAAVGGGVLLLESLARAVMAWLPFATVVEFQVALYGAVVSVATTVPSTRKSTEDTATLSAAVALTATEVPETVAPSAGAVRLTVGAVVSALLT